MDKLPTKTSSLNHDYRKTFNSEEGKRVLRDLMVECHLFEGLPGHLSSTEMFYGEGQRSAVMYILTKLQEPQDPDRYRQQLEQANIDYTQRRTQ